jgi:hypothetical protein
VHSIELDVLEDVVVTAVGVFVLWVLWVSGWCGCVGGWVDGVEGERGVRGWKYIEGRERRGAGDEKYTHHLT